jgi:hypothetical protein
MINKDSNHKVEQYQYQAMEIIAIWMIFFSNLTEIQMKEFQKKILIIIR